MFSSVWELFWLKRLHRDNLFHFDVFGNCRIPNKRNSPHTIGFWITDGFPWICLYTTSSAQAMLFKIPLLTCPKGQSHIRTTATRARDQTSLVTSISVKQIRETGDIGIIGPQQLCPFWSGSGTRSVWHPSDACGPAQGDDAESPMT